MRKKSLYLIILAVILVVGVALGSVLFVKKQQNENDSKPTPTASSTPTTSALRLNETKQSLEGGKYGTYFLNYTGTPENEVNLVPLAAYTAANYTEKAFFNPYFITKYWETKDKYAKSSLDTYIFPYVNDDIKKDLTAKLETGENLEANFSPYLAFYPADKNVLPNCYDSWNEDYCYAGAPPTFTNMSFEQINEKTMKVTASFKVDTVLQKTDGLEGDSVIETRNYTVNYLMSVTNQPDTLDTDVPIMIIDGVNVESLDISTTDYLVTGEG
jgi:hypothetical protein